MIAVDTSVWVSALREGTATTAPVLGTLLDADEVVLPLPVRIELMAGVGRSQRASLRRALTALPVVYPTDAVWQRVEGWVETAANAGFTFGQTDLLIAALADDVGTLVWSLDSDFAQMEALGLARLYP